MTQCSERNLDSDSADKEIAVAPHHAPLLVRMFALAILATVSISVGRFLLNIDSDLFKLGEESNISTWLSSIQLFVIAVVLTPLAVRDVDRDRKNTWALALVPIFFALLSLDEVAKLHERLGDLLISEFGVGAEVKSGPWIIAFVPLVAAAAVLVALQLWPYVRHRRRPLFLMGMGVVILGLAAVGLEVAANFAVEDSVAHRAFAFSEETGEMIGANLILWGAVLLACDEGIRVDLGAGRDPRAD